MTKANLLFVVFVLITVFVIGAAFFLEETEKSDIFLETEMVYPENTQEKMPEENLPEMPLEDARVAKIALVLDDFGYNKRNLNAVKALNVPLTLAVLPATPYAGDVARFAEKNDLEVILHLPMEPKNMTEALEVDTILVDMDLETIKGIIDKALDSVPFSAGVSNHMGSKATGDRILVKRVLGHLKEKGMFFLDSFTMEGSICMEVAGEVGIPYARRDIFIDNNKDAEYITEQLKKCGEAAIKNKEVVAIGHDRTLTVSVLSEMIPLIKAKGVQFVKVSELIKVQDKRQ